MTTLTAQLRERPRLKYTLVASATLIGVCLVTLVAADLGTGARALVLVAAFAGLAGVAYATWPRRALNPEQQETEQNRRLHERGYFSDDAPAGWYFSTDEAPGIQRYYDGTAWTSQRRHREVTWRDEPAKVRAISRLIGLVFLVPAALLTFDGPSVGSIGCGSWINPNYDAVWKLHEDMDNAFSGTAIDRMSSDMLYAGCSEKLADRRTLVLVLLGVGLAGSLAFTRAVDWTRRPLNA